jgi:tripartite-type tricarboxylate transporter receptor subunit TctC
LCEGNELSFRQFHTSILPSRQLVDLSWEWHPRTALRIRANAEAFQKESTMDLPRRKFMDLVAAAAVLPALSRIARAQVYPTRPVRLIVPFTPAGGADIMARLLSQPLSERFGQQFIVENRPGAGSNIGTEAVVRAPPDGYTLLLMLTPNAVNATLFEKLNFNFIRDIAPVAGISREPNVLLVHPSVPANTVGDFIAYVKANPGEITMASSGNGSSPHIAGELFKLMSGVNMVHIPYRGAGPALTDLLGGQVQVMFATMSSSLAYIKDGKLRPLAVTASSRSEVLPDIPTVDESLPGYEASTWYGVGAPKGTPRGIIEKLNGEINSILGTPQMQAKLATLGTSTLLLSPAQLGKLIADETEKWGKLIRAANIRPE